MTDRELLERAAKAAGIAISVSCFREPDYLPVAYLAGTTTRWDPKNRDGDALRLAVKLSTKYGITIEIKRDKPSGNADAEAPDAYAATRLAILRAAAAMARVVPIAGLHSDPPIPNKKNPAPESTAPEPALSMTEEP